MTAQEVRVDTNCWHTAAHLVWRESMNTGKEFTLLSGAMEAGRLSLSGWCSLEATAATAFGSWTIRAEGFWKPRILVRDGSTGALVAECSRPWMSSDRIIAWQDGKIYQWQRSGWWSDVVKLIDPVGRCLMIVHLGDEKATLRDLFKTHGSVEICFGEPDGMRLALLTVVSWYLFLMHREEMASVVVIG